MKRPMFLLLPLILFLRCEFTGNIYNPDDPSYEKPSFAIDKEVSDVADGDTVIADTLRITLRGNDEMYHHNRFRWSLDDGKWTNWDGDGKATYEIVLSALPEGNHTLTIEVCYNPDEEKSDLTITFFKGIKGVPCRVFYNGNGSTGGEVPIDTQKYEEGDTVTIAGNSKSLVKNGNTFIGWDTTALEPGNKAYNPGEHFIMGTKDITLYARWTTTNYSITYNLYDGKNGANPASYTIESETIDFTAATKTSYTFDGWYADKNFTGTKVTSIPGGSTGNREFWAKWIITDIDGNIYTEVKIGNQVWMVENLKTTRYRDGTAIPRVTRNAEWAALSSPGCCWYDNDSATYNGDYGILYNWYTVADTNTHKLAPAGWHIPTDAEWTELEEYLIANGYNWDGTTTGNKIGKSLAATTGWNPSSKEGDIGNDMSSNNSTGFSALPGGFRYDGGTFLTIGLYGNWWSATESDAAGAWGRYLTCDAPYLNRDGDNGRMGFSVRCVRD